MLLMTLAEYKYQSRWVREEERIHAIFEALREGRDWTVYLIEQPDTHSFKTLAHVLDGHVPQLEGCRAPKDLRGVPMNNIETTLIMNLSETCLDYASIENMDFKNMSFNGTSFKYSRLSNISFEGAHIVQSSFYNARLFHVSFGAATLNLCDLSGAFIDNCVFVNSNIIDIKFNEEPWHGFLLRLFGARTWTQITNLHPLNKREMELIDDDFVFFLYGQKHIGRLNSFRLLSFLHYNFINFGRLSFWIIIIWFLFGFFYSGYPLPVVLEDTNAGAIFQYVCPRFDWGSGAIIPQDWYDPYIFSIMTSTTFYLGDVKPLNFMAKTLIAANAICGLIAFGIFVALLMQAEKKIEK